MESKEGKFVFKIAGPDKKESTLKRDVAMLRFLEKNKFSAAPKILATKSWQPYRRVSGRFVYAMKHAGSPPRSSLKNWHELGKALASLHLIRSSTIPKSSFTVAAQRAKMLKRAKSFKMEAGHAEIWRSLRSFDKLPQSIIHTDPGIHNTVQRKNGSLVLVDWEDAGRGPSVLDIGYVLTSFLTSKFKFEDRKTIAFLKGYTSKRKISGDEKFRVIDAGLVFGLSYSIDEKRGVDPGYWEWTQYIAGHRYIFERVLNTVK